VHVIEPAARPRRWNEVPSTRRVHGNRTHRLTQAQHLSRVQLGGSICQSDARLHTDTAKAASLPKKGAKYAPLNPHHPTLAMKKRCSLKTERRGSR
jgi:hypothetical protein